MDIVATNKVNQYVLVKVMNNSIFINIFQRDSLAEYSWGISAGMKQFLWDNLAGTEQFLWDVATGTEQFFYVTRQGRNRLQFS